MIVIIKTRDIFFCENGTLLSKRTWNLYLEFEHCFKVVAITIAKVEAQLKISIQFKYITHQKSYYHITKFFSYSEKQIANILRNIRFLLLQYYW